MYLELNSYWKYKSYILNKLVIYLIYTHTHTHTHTQRSYNWLNCSCLSPTTLPHTFTTLLRTFLLFTFSNNNRGDKERVYPLFRVRQCREPIVAAACECYIMCKEIIQKSSIAPITHGESAGHLGHFTLTLTTHSHTPTFTHTHTHLCTCNLLILSDQQMHTYTYTSHTHTHTHAHCTHTHTVHRHTHTLHTHTHTVHRHTHTLHTHTHTVHRHTHTLHTHKLTYSREHWSDQPTPQHARQGSEPTCWVSSAFSPHVASSHQCCEAEGRSLHALLTKHIPRSVVWSRR